jgi:hypothetical protein
MIKGTQEVNSWRLPHMGSLLMSLNRQETSAYYSAVWEGKSAINNKE